MVEGSPGRSTRRPRQGGFTYLSALLLIGVLCAGLGAIAESWTHARQREKEAELIWIGSQFTQAIALYYHRSPGTLKRHPEKLDDLLLDKRFLGTQRYLRRIYGDPMTGKAEWDPIPSPSGGIMGVRSKAAGKAIRTADGETYRDWKFVYEPPVVPAGPARTPLK